MRGTGWWVNCHNAMMERAMMDGQVEGREGLHRTLVSQAMENPQVPRVQDG